VGELAAGRMCGSLSGWAPDGWICAKKRRRFFTRRPPPLRIITTPSSSLSPHTPSPPPPLSRPRRRPPVWRGSMDRLFDTCSALLETGMATPRSGVAGCRAFRVSKKKQRRAKRNETAKAPKVRTAPQTQVRAVPGPERDVCTERANGRRPSTHAEPAPPTHALQLRTRRNGMNPPKTALTPSPPPHRTRHAHSDAENRPVSTRRRCGVKHQARAAMSPVRRRSPGPPATRTCPPLYDACVHSYTPRSTSRVYAWLL